MSNKSLVTNFFQQARYAQESEASLGRQISRGMDAVRNRFGSRVAISQIDDSVIIEFRAGGRAPTPEEITEVETLMHFGKIPDSTP